VPFTAGRSGQTRLCCHPPFDCFGTFRSPPTAGQSSSMRLASHAQVASFRVLREDEIERIRGDQAIPFDLRVLAATNKNLSAAVGDGTFYQDLSYRFNIFRFNFPRLVID
jgi:hypothetical protein